MSLFAPTVNLAQSPFPPLAVGFMGLGTGYLIYGTQELFAYPKRNASVDLGTGIWGLWMPGFMQLFAGIYLFAGLTLFGTFTKSPPLYMAGLAFTAYGVHWLALGWTRMSGTDVRVQLGMSIAFISISALGAVIFFTAGDWPVGLLFVGLACVYVCEFGASLGPDIPAAGVLSLRGLGFFHLLVGLWLMYLMWAVALDLALGYTVPR
jgi:hypothetical protein